MFHSIRVRPGAPLAVAAFTAALVLAPVAAFAEDDAAPDAPPAVSAPVDEAAPPAVDPPAAPDVVVVDADDTSVAEVLAESPEVPTVTVFADTDTAADAPVVAAAPVPGDACYPAVCIDNGTILLAVNPTGELNTSDATGSPAGPGDAGLAYLPTGNDSTSPGCLCEGWGVADPASGVWGGANIAREGPGGHNLAVDSFTYTGSTATSVVTVADDEGAPYFRVTHEYVPAAGTPDLYQVNVTIENLTGDTIATVQYRRVMDWDVEPTAFDEFVTIDRGTASAITFTSDDGFASSNPLTGPSSILFTGNAVDSGPADHGALFDFAFGPLTAGGSLSFVIFYGGAADQASAEAALAAVGAEAYSFGQTSTDPATGTPNTFVFAFGKVGGAPIFTPPTAAESVPPAAVPPVARAVPAVADVAAPAHLAVTGGSSATVGIALGAAVAALVVGAAALGLARVRRAH